jgi:membrane protease YdiL (CAAX protease family)
MTALAAVLALVLSPPAPNARLEPVLAAAAGVAVGSLLFVAAARRRPALPSFRVPRVGVAKQAVLGLCAANEEVIWRRVALGELLPTSVIVALTVSSIGFGLAHRRSRILHVVTGLTFGTVYLATGSLVACVLAHWIYNGFVGSLAKRAPP